MAQSPSTSKIESSSHETRKKRIMEIFQKFDTNKDGNLSREEIKQGLRSLKLPHSEDTIDLLLKTLDANQDGQVTFEEFETFVMNQEEKLRKVFDELDVNKNGYIDLEEVKQSLIKLNMKCSPEDVQLLMKRIDKDKNGLIDFEEWQYWADATTLYGEEEVIPPPKHKPKTFSASLQYLASGALAGVTSRTTTAPLERLKIIYQIQTKRPPNIFAGLANIYHESGWRGFFRGNGANCLKVAPESAVKFFTYETLKKVLSPGGEEHVQPQHRFIAGGLAGVAAHTTVFPLEVVKTRLSVSEKGVYRNITDAFIKIAKTEGYFRPFYRGLTPSLVSTIPSSGTNLTVYETLKKGLLKYTGDKEPKVWMLLTCSTISSTCGQLVSYPLHVFKSRLVAQGTPGIPKQYNGLIDVIVKTTMKEGLFGLYRGILPSLMKTVPANWVIYSTYELTKRFLGVEKRH